MSSKMRVHYSSERQDWGTPQAFFDQMNEAHGPFNLDVCASALNHKTPKYFTEQDNGLSQRWLVNDKPSTAWMNPPYGRQIGLWVAKAYRESRDGSKVCCLLPARTDTRWFHDYAMYACVDFIRGRLKFEGASHGAPFPSMIMRFGYNAWRPGLISQTGKP
jgi:phage N-6-adenine-methyltransferase